MTERRLLRHSVAFYDTFGKIATHFSVWRTGYAFYYELKGSFVSFGVLKIGCEGVWGVLEEFSFQFFLLAKRKDDKFEAEIITRKFKGMGNSEIANHTDPSELTAIILLLRPT